MRKSVHHQLQEGRQGPAWLRKGLWWYSARGQTVGWIIGSWSLFYRARVWFMGWQRQFVVLYRHSKSREDESYWYWHSLHFSYDAPSRQKFYFQNFVQTSMVPSHWIVMTLVIPWHFLYQHQKTTCGFLAKCLYNSWVDCNETHMLISPSGWSVIALVIL